MLSMNIFKTFEIFNRETISIIQERIIRFVYVESENFFRKGSVLKIAQNHDNTLQLNVFNNKKVYNLLTCVFYKQKSAGKM
jgi:hypothetical protein